MVLEKVSVFCSVLTLLISNTSSYSRASPTEATTMSWVMLVEVVGHLGCPPTIFRVGGTDVGVLLLGF